MAHSHSAIGAEILTEDGNGQDSLRYEAAMEHHLNALKLVLETERLRAAFNISSLISASKAKATFIGAAMSVRSGGRRLTTRSRDLSVVS